MKFKKYTREEFDEFCDANFIKNESNNIFEAIKKQDCNLSMDKDGVIISIKVPLKCGRIKEENRK